MQWYYAKGPEQVGPLSQDQFDALVKSGEITTQTLVWRLGMVQWLPYHAVSQPTSAGRKFCNECGKEFPDDDLVKIENSYVCAGCKPILLQKLKEGVGISGSGNLWRHKKIVVLRRNAIFPDRCIKCNAPATRRLKRKLFWHHPAIYFLVLCNLVIYAIVSVIVRKRADIEIGLCNAHVSSRNRMIGIAWGLFAASLIELFFATKYSLGWLGGLTVLTFLASLVCSVFPRMVSAEKIEAEYIRVRGAGRAFLDSLPEWL